MNRCCVFGDAENKNRKQNWKRRLSYHHQWLSSFPTLWSRWKYFSKIMKIYSIPPFARSLSWLSCRMNFQLAFRLFSHKARWKCVKEMLSVHLVNLFHYLISDNREHQQTTNEEKRKKVLLFSLIRFLLTSSFREFQFHIDPDHVERWKNFLINFERFLEEQYIINWKHNSKK